MLSSLRCGGAVVEQQVVGVNRGWGCNELGNTATKAGVMVIGPWPWSSWNGTACQ